MRVLYLAAPGRNLQSAPFAGILTEGTTVRVHGRGLGTAALAALLGAGQEPSASLQEVGDVAVIGTSGDTEQDWTDVRISSGEGRGLTFAYVIASQVASVALRFRAPTVIRATPLPNEVPRTSGGFAIDVFGTDFGVSGQVVVTVGGRPCPAPGVGAAFSATQFRCVAPQGAGSASPVVVTVAGQTGTTTLAYATPTVTAVSPASAPSDAIDAATGDSILLEVAGANFGPSSVGTLELWWTPPGASAPVLFAAFSNATSPPSSAASPLRAAQRALTGVPASLVRPPTSFGAVEAWTHERITVRLPASAGQAGVHPVVVAADQDSGQSAQASSAVLSFDRPSVSGVRRLDRSDCSPRQVCFGAEQCRMFPAGCYPTAGGFVVAVEGASFGTTDPALRPVVTMGGRPCLPPASGPPAAHRSVECVVPAGIGDRLEVVVTSPLGRSSDPSADSGAVFAYDPPVIRALVPNTPDSRGDEVDIVGVNFGGIAAPVRIVIDDSECEDSMWINDNRMSCRTPALRVGPKNVSIFAANRTEPWDIFAWEGLFVTECKPGSYGLAGELCVTCDVDAPGASCPGGERDFDLVRSQPGWWRFNVSGTDAVECPHSAVRSSRTGEPHFCPSIKPCEPAWACLGSNLCVEGYTGDRCGQCDGGFYRISGLCEKCPDNPWLTPVLLAVLVLCAGAGGWVMNAKQARQPLIMVGVDGAQVLAMFARSRVRWVSLAAACRAPCCPVPSLLLPR